MLLERVIFTGCQHIVKSQSPATQNQTEQLNEFDLQGKIGVRTPKQSGSAFLLGLSIKINLILSSAVF